MPEHMKNNKPPQWVEGYYLYDKRSGKSYIMAGSNGGIEIDPATVGQCTGLKDKNGTLIFEGDIVKYDNGNQAYVATVEWWDTGLCIKSDDFMIKGERRRFSTNPSKYEIINNIHEGGGDS